MIPRNMAILFGTLLIGCGEVPLDSKEPSGEVLTEDADGDGVSEEEGDCDDSNPNISPSATDLVGDEIDQNCDGIDGMDLDGDGYASEVSGGDDCDDSDPEVYPADEDGDGSTLCDEVADCDDSNPDSPLRHSPVILLPALEFFPRHSVLFDSKFRETVRDRIRFKVSFCD